MPLKICELLHLRSTTFLQLKKLHRPRECLYWTLSFLKLTPKKTKLKSVCATRWVDHHDSLITCQEGFPFIVVDLAELEHDQDADTASKAVCFSSAITQAPPPPSSPPEEILTTLLQGSYGLESTAISLDEFYVGSESSSLDNLTDALNGFSEPLSAEGSCLAIF
uniref:Uncharacterized protein n=1 Tax=Timema bartmani TaxID=61472 RepID=A0A7R9I021_9NEOP|nr:unnamed protein product [Timema bartmani]